MKYYAVANGRTRGIFTEWEDCKVSTDKFKNVRYKSFKKLSEAVDYIANNSDCSELLKKLNEMYQAIQ